ncbi:hypothetical protein [Campylobacter sp. MIT 97-5078]|uniref:hypothetical protein n=1 Tax=Campylobacter sp. MIT 97-5078 TaxID=1548153 RepID=UPI000513A813|nr:hypothetical protein [Campylobacter sp. MIT 97-5078]KGI55234.1 hypothetical protein LR59_12875 [Campylobacter sp. MIT 97-5078]TQR27416.1 hypothetical protein DMB91_03935 [Campylobacter sp. MIT 97-5078]
MEAVSCGAINPIFNPSQSSRRESFEDCIASFKNYNKEKARKEKLKQQGFKTKRNKYKNIIFLKENV